MGKKNRLLLLAIFSSILFLGSSFTPIDSYEIGWVIGEQYQFGLSMYEYYEERNTSNGNYEIEEYRSAFELSFNVTDIDLENKLMDFSYWFPDGYLEYWNNYNFDMAIYSEYIFSHTNDFFTIDFRWDTATDSVVLYNFYIDFWFDPLFFVEPVWLDFNEALKNVFNSSTIVDVVDVPDSETDIEVTFGYFLAILTDFRINNKNSLNNALNQFTADNTELLLHFDLSNVIHDNFYDEDLGHDVLLPLEDFKVDFELSYSDGGILDYYKQRIEEAYTYENEYEKMIYDYNYAYGGLNKLKTPLNLFSIIPAILVSALILKYSMKKKKGEDNQ